MPLETKKYKKKPLRIEAVQITLDNAADVAFWCGGQLSGADDLATVSILIPTLEGNMEAKANDFVAKGIVGEFYPIKPDIFNDSYDEIV